MQDQSKTEIYQPRAHSGQNHHVAGRGFHVDMYGKIVELANDVMYVLNRERIITYVNKAMCNMTGYTPDEMIGKSLLDFIPEEINSHANKIIVNQHRGISERVEGVFLHKNGEKIDI
ncbi:MAG: PAS domain S-box protein, partial [Candidatus Magnetominusculus sp. LBB02]|nr:PAS domain S-box protein [Candidatus Magnetominusculus sp. LBB02]